LRNKHCAERGRRADPSQDHAGMLRLVGTKRVHRFRPRRPKVRRRSVQSSLNMRRIAKNQHWSGRALSIQRLFRTSVNLLPSLVMRAPEFLDSPFISPMKGQRRPHTECERRHERHPENESARVFRAVIRASPHGLHSKSGRCRSDWEIAPRSSRCNCAITTTRRLRSPADREIVGRPRRMAKANAD